MSIKFGMKLFEFLPIYTHIQSKYLCCTQYPKP